MNAQNKEKGQTLVLIILAIAGLMGFAALAVDGGRLYAERRRAQSAADAAALGAAFAATQGNDWLASGMNLSVTNGFDNNGLTNTVTINHPPVSGPYQDDENYYQVIIWQQVDPIFSQFVFGNEMGITTEAVARARPITSVSTGNAIHSLDPSWDSMIWDGALMINVKGGNIYSNGHITKNGSASGDGGISVTEGGIIASSGLTRNGNPTISPAEQPGVPQNYEDLPEPYCPDHDETYNGVNYYYHTGLNGSATLEPGFHCFYGDIRLGGNDHVEGRNVVLVMMEGGISMTGNSTMDIKRPNDIEDKNGNHWGGLLIYAPPSNTNTFTLGGTNDSKFTGTVLAPGALCDIGGTAAGNGWHTAMICWQVRNHGTSDVKIIYKEEENLRLTSIVELSQ